MRLASLVLLSGCSLVWGVEDYRGDEMDSGLVDASRDTSDDVSLDAVADVFDDTETDASRLDAPLDSEVDDADEDADTLGCLTEEIEGPVTVLDEPLEFVRVRMTQPGFAINVLGPGRVENVEVVLMNPAASGIQVQNLGARINQVRVTPMLEGVAAEGDGLVLNNSQNAEIAGLELVGLPLKIFNGDNNKLSFVEIINVRRDASPAEPVSAVEIVTASGVILSDFHIREGMTSHAISCSTSTNINFLRGYIDMDTVDYSFVARGPNELFVNQVTDVAIRGSARGVLLTVPTGEWDLFNVQVERAADCAAGDYAFDTSMALGAMLDGTASQRLCMRPARNGAGTLDRANITLEPIEATDFCFPRTLAF